MFLAAILKNHQKLEIKFPSTGELLYIHKRNITQQYKGTTATLLNMDKPQWHYTECIYTIFWKRQKSIVMQNRSQAAQGWGEGRV